MFKLLDGQCLDQTAVKDARSTAGAISATNQILLRRADQLSQSDRLLVELYVGCQWTHRRIGERLDIPYSTVARRLRRIGKLLHDPLIIRLIDGPCPLDRADRQIAVGYFLHRRSLRDLAMMHDLSVPAVSRRLQFVRGWFRGATVRKNAEG